MNLGHQQDQMQFATPQITRYPPFNTAQYEGTTRELQDVVSRRFASFYRNAYLLLGNRADAEDAVQDALLSACKHLHQFRRQSQMSTWLTSIVCNCARMQLRRRSRKVHASLDENIGPAQESSLLDRLADSAPDPEERCRNSELSRHLMESVDRLPSILRMTFQLREINGLSICETARILGVPNGTVKARLSRARAKVKKSISRALKQHPLAFSPVVEPASLVRNDKIATILQERRYRGSLIYSHGPYRKKAIGR